MFDVSESFSESSRRGELRLNVVTCGVYVEFFNQSFKVRELMEELFRFSQLGHVPSHSLNLQFEKRALGKIKSRLQITCKRGTDEVT